MQSKKKAVQSVNNSQYRFNVYTMLSKIDTILSFYQLTHTGSLRLGE